MRERGWKWAQTTTWQVESGKKSLSVNEASALADALGVTLAWLTEDHGDAVDAVLRERAALDAVRDRLAVAIYDEWFASARLAGAATGVDMPEGLRDAVRRDLSLDVLDLVRRAVDADKGVFNLPDGEFAELWRETKGEGL